MTVAVPELPPRVPVVVTPGTARSVHWLGGRMDILDTGALSLGAFSCAVDSLPGGGGPVWHRHARETEAFYVLDGAADFHAANAPAGTRVRAGGLIALPPGVPHRFRNARADAGSPLFMVTAPGGNMQFFADLSAPVAEPDDPTHPPDPAAFAAAGRRYGITMLGPDEAAGARIADEIVPLGGGRYPVAVPAGAGEAWALGSPGGAANVVVKLSAATTGGRLTLAEIALAPGASLPALRHAAYGAGAFPLDGPLTLETLGDGEPRETDVPKHGLAVLPFGAPYRLRNDAAGPVRFLFVAAPAGIEDFWRAAGVPSAVTAAGVVPEGIRHDPDRVAAAGRDWGVEVDPQGR